jgi:hypothetical protein
VNDTPWRTKMSEHKVKIICGEEPHDFKLYIDDLEVNGVVDVKFHTPLKGANTLIVELLPLSVEIQGNCEVKKIVLCPKCGDKMEEPKQ